MGDGDRLPPEVNIHTGLAGAICQLEGYSLHATIETHVIGIGHCENCAEPLAGGQIGEFVSDPILDEGSAFRTELSLKQFASSDEGQLRAVMAQAVEPITRLITPTVERS